MRRFQRLIISFFTFIGGFYFFLEFVLPKTIGTFEFGAYHEQILKGVQVIGIMAIGLGIISIVRVHSKNILNKKGGWINSVALLAGFFLMLGFQWVNFLQERAVNSVKKEIELDRKFLVVIDKEQTERAVRPRLDALAKGLRNREAELLLRLGSDFNQKEEFANLRQQISITSDSYTDVERQRLDLLLGTLNESLSTSIDLASKKSFSKRAVDLFTNGLFVPLGSAMFALLAFYIANAAYRSFRVRSIESLILMSAAIIVMLGQIPQGPMYISENLPFIRLWLLKNVSTPAFRAIFFGSSIAGLAMAIRIWLSLERGPLDDTGEG